jgi:hypothetical protein
MGGGGEKNAYSLLVGKLEGRRPLGRLRHRWVDSIRMGFVEIVLDELELIGLAQNRYSRRTLLNSVMKHRVS